MGDFWNEDSGDFRDNPVEMVDGRWEQNEIAGPPAQPLTESQRKALAETRARANAPTPQEDPRQPPEQEFELPQVDLDEEEDYTSVLSDARLRLEQGRLYELVINHDLFEGADADPVAAKHVQGQIRRFAKEQMEIMLGMRKETAKVEHLEIDFPFNAVEVNVLRKLAHAASKGASENSDRFVPEVTKTTKEVDVVPRREGLNKIAAKKAPTKPAPVATKPQQRPQPAPQKPLPRATTALIREKAAEAGLTPDEAALLEPDYKPLGKPLHQMTELEKAERIRQTTERMAKRKTAKSPFALPPATPDQEAMLAQAQVMTADSKGAVSSIMALINNSAKK